jgi:hypothetical protein
MGDPAIFDFSHVEMNAEDVVVRTQESAARASRVHVPAQVELNLEIDIGDDERELEIERKW